jgi:hypothetical protein
LRVACTLLILLAAVCFRVPSQAATAPYGVATSPAPVLNVPDVTSIFGGRDQKTLKTDRCGQVRELEFIALPGTVFTLRGEFKDGERTVYRVETDEYTAPPGARLYLDSSFVELRQERPQSRERQL